MELNASLIDRDTVLESACDLNPKRRPVIKASNIKDNRGDGGDRNRDVGWLSWSETGKPLSSDANDGDGLAFDADLLPYCIARAAETLLPELVANHGHLGS